MVIKESLMLRGKIHNWFFKDNNGFWVGYFKDSMQS